MKHRAIELYCRNTPFKPKVVKSKKVYNRKKVKKEPDANTGKGLR